MPKRSFVETKRELKRLYLAYGEPISDRTAHRLAQGIMLSDFAANAQRSAPAEKSNLDYKDETGETAVENVILAAHLQNYQAQKNGPGAVAKQISGHRRLKCNPLTISE